MPISLVENEAPLAATVRGHSKSMGHVSDWFITLDEAPSAVSTSQFDLTLPDLQLPDGDGLSLRPQVRAMATHTAIITPTACDKISDAPESRKRVANDPNWRSRMRPEPTEYLAAW